MNSLSVLQDSARFSGSTKPVRFAWADSYAKPQAPIRDGQPRRWQLRMGAFSCPAVFAAAARPAPRFANSGHGVLVVTSQTTDENVDDNSWSPLGVFHKRGDIVAGKYKVIGVLGQGGVGTTYEAEIEDGSTVALKAVSLRNMKAWKDLELFEREARVLKTLKHPSIPEYIDYFEVDSESDRAFYIAQKVARGRSLADLVQNGFRVTEDDVVRIAVEILEVLKYLGSLRPPVYHRDIKPENIIMDEDSGQVKVVDFGAVQDAASVTLIGSTVIGTYGYMAPEQFQNRATLQTDLYGLGATLLYLSSGRPPSAFPQKRLKVDFSSVTMSPGLRAVIDKLLEPAPEDRFQSAVDVIMALKNLNEPLSRAGLRFGEVDPNRVEMENVERIRKPAGTKVDILRGATTLEITIPPVGLTAETVGTGTFGVAWNAFLFFWTGAAIRGGAGVMSLFSIPFWVVGIGLAKSTLSNLTVAVNIKVDEENFAIEWRVGSLWKHRVCGEIKDISTLDVTVEGEMNGRPLTTCILVEGVNRHLFGAGLEPIEKDWIIQEMREFLGLPQLGKAARNRFSSFRPQGPGPGRRDRYWDDEAGHF